MVLTKDYIADTAVDMIRRHGVDKLTVKDLVEACQMTRQTFYYHFDDLPDLLRYLVQRQSSILEEQARAGADLDAMLRYFVHIIDENDDLIPRMLNSHYHDMVDEVLFRALHSFLFTLYETSGQDPMSARELEFAVSYNAFAIKDILIFWRKEKKVDTDTVLTMVRRLIAGQLQMGRQAG